MRRAARSHREPARGRVALLRLARRPPRSPARLAGARSSAGRDRGTRRQADAAAAARVTEVAYDLERRVRQELAYPTVVHFYTWLLQGAPRLQAAPPRARARASQAAGGAGAGLAVAACAGRAHAA
jgi:hypothetical protein